MEAMLYEWDCIAKNLAATRVSTRHARVRAPQMFRSEQDEHKFWDSTEFIAWQSGYKRKFPKLKRRFVSRQVALRYDYAPIEDLFS